MKTGMQNQVLSPEVRTVLLPVMGLHPERPIKGDRLQFHRKAVVPAAAVLTQLLQEAVVPIVIPLLQGAAVREVIQLQAVVPMEVVAAPMEAVEVQEAVQVAEEVHQAADAKE